MTEGRRVRLSAEQRTEIWRRWKAGESLREIGRDHIATLVERHSRFVILVKVPSKDTATVVAALSRQVRKLPASLNVR